jgi:hypothetical protein
MSKFHTDQLAPLPESVHHYDVRPWRFRERIPGPSIHWRRLIGWAVFLLAVWSVTFVATYYAAKEVF